MIGRGRMGLWFDRSLGVAVLVMMGAVLAQPGGVVRTRVDRFLSERQVDAAVRDHWHEIVGSEPTDAPRRPVLVEFMDYQCPFCRRAEDTLAAYASLQNLKVVYRHYPISALHPRAEEAARAALCAEEAGVFEQAHTYLIREEWWEDSAPLAARSAELGIADTASFRQCLTSPRVEQRLRHDRELAMEVKVRGTPVFVGPNGVHHGLISTSEIGDLLGPPDVS